MKKVIAPKGYFFKVVKDYYRNDGYFVKLFKRGIDEEIGNVNLVEEYSKCYETHSYLMPEYRNKGLGARMYAKAIQWGHERGYRVRSSGGPSDDAKRVWRGSFLKRFFDVRVYRCRHYRNKKIFGPIYKTFYPLPKKEDRCRVSLKKRSAKKRK